MKSIPFVKMEGSGNDFVLIDGRFSVSRTQGTKSFVARICDRKFGVGADGVLLTRASKKADVRMRIFNADGSQAQMCGNGARCVALYFFKSTGRKTFSIETGAGLIGAQVKGETIRLKMTDPSDVRLDLHVTVGGRRYEVDYVNTGVPHAVIEVDDLESVPVTQIGRAIRHHRVFAPVGTNVDFMRRRPDGRVLIRTYERGVEDETLACGTGSVAAAIISVLNHEAGGQKSRWKRCVRIETRSSEILSVYMTVSKKRIFDVWLEGRARVVYQGEYYL